MAITAKERKENKKKSYEEKRKHQKEEGKVPQKKRTYSNAKCTHKTIDEENQYDQRIWEEQLKFFKCFLAVILKRLSKIKDFRNVKKKKH